MSAAVQARDVDRILRERAKALARRDDGADEHATEAFATFSIGGHRFGVPIAQVVHGADLKLLTEIPGGPPWLMGLVAVGGHLVSLLDLAVLLGLERRGVRDVTAVLVVSDGKREIGLAADELDGIEDVPGARIAALPGAAGPAGHLARGRAEERDLLLLDVELLFADARLREPR